MFRKNRQLILGLLKNVSRCSKYYDNCKFIETLDNSLRNDIEFLYEVININPKIFKFASETIQWPVKPVCKIVKKKPWTLKYLRHGTLWKMNDFEGYFSCIKDLYEAHPSTLEYTIKMIFSLFTIEEGDNRTLFKVHQNFLKMYLYFLEMKPANFSYFDIEYKIKIRNNFFPWPNLFLNCIRRTPKTLKNIRNNLWIFKKIEILPFLEREPMLMLDHLQALETTSLEKAKKELKTLIKCKKVQQLRKLPKPVIITIFMHLYRMHLTANPK